MSKLNNIGLELLPQLFKQQAALTANKVAVSDSNRELTYAELDTASESLAQQLLCEELSNNARIGVYVERSVDLLVCLLGVLKAGMAYVPLDPEQPASRLKSILLDSGAERVLALTESAASLTQVTDGLVPAVFYNAKLNSTKKLHSLPVISKKSLAYVIYTSGSTGKPKGVMVSHGALSSFLKAMLDVPGLAENEMLLAVTTYCFDIAAFELFGPILVGATCLIAPQKSVSSGRELVALIASSKPDVMQATPSTWWMMYQTGWLNTENVRAYCGGEALPPVLAEKFKQTETDAWNLYGPTEATIWATVDKLKSNGSVTLGKPLSNSVVHIVDAHDNPLTPSSEGEIAISGAGLAEGYWNLPELTAQRFRTPQWLNGERLYLTGDLGRVNALGDIEYLGRIDDQIKLRGYRIEPAEIETCLMSHAAIAECAVVLSKHKGHDQLTACCVTPDNVALPDFRELRQYLAAHIPEYMIPVRYLQLQQLPLNTNRKLDRKALLAYCSDGSAALNETQSVKGSFGDHLLKNQTEIESRILTLWSDALGIDGIRADDGFFDVGGDSVLAVSIVELLQQEWSVTFDVVDLFEYPNAQSLSLHLAQQLEQSEKDQNSNTQTRLKAEADAIAPAKMSENSNIDQHKEIDADSQGYSSLDAHSDITPAVKAVPTSTAENKVIADDAVAIIGISCQYPGADNHQQFWQNLLDGVESVQRLSIKEARDLGVAEHMIADPKYVPVRATINNKASFDPSFFNLSRRDAEHIDPQVRLLLQHAWNAVEDAGYNPADLQQTGVIATTSQTSYPMLGREHESTTVFEDYRDYQDILYAQSGTLPTLIAYKLGLKGPCFAVQSNCSSSLVALDQACAGIKRGDASSYLVAAASVFPSDLAGYIHQDGLNFSSDGHLKAFDSDADGMVSGEGVAVLLVKSARLAIEHKDPIYALISGSALNNDGATKPGYYVPSANGQTDVILKAQKRAGIKASAVNYIEAHGTGTQLGDPIELKALRDAFASNEGDQARCAVGSVKSNIGHTDAAAGLAGIIKTALGLSLGVIPRTINFEQANARLKLENSPFAIAERNLEIPMTLGVDRYAGVSSFGIGGTNAHVILQQHIAEPVSNASANPACLGFVLSARADEQLRDRALGIIAAIDNGIINKDSFLATAYTLAVGRKAMECRLAVLAESVESLREKLNSFVNGNSGVENVWTSSDKLSGSGDARAKALGEKLMQWAHGGKLSWDAMYQGITPPRMHLPTYPFAQEHYWIETAGNQQQVTLQAQSLPVPSDAVLAIITGDRVASTLSDYVEQVRTLRLESWNTVESVTAQLDSVDEIEQVVCIVNGSSGDSGNNTAIWRTIVESFKAQGYASTNLTWFIPSNTGKSELIRFKELINTVPGWTLHLIDAALNRENEQNSVVLQQTSANQPVHMPMNNTDPVIQPYAVSASDLKNVALDDNDDLLDYALIVSLKELGIHQLTGNTISEIQNSWHVVPEYQRWLEATLNELSERGWLTRENQQYRSTDALKHIDAAQVEARWKKRKDEWSAYADRKAVAMLTQNALEELPNILQGKKRATDVLFPAGSMDLISSLYKNNPVADYFSEAVAEQIAAISAYRKAQGNHNGLRILEVGAGTGGTSCRIFDRFKTHTDDIELYCYTDLSQGFLRHAELQYGPIAPYLETKIFNVEMPPQGQSIDIASFDIIVAANVLHATQDMRVTVKHCRSLLKENGYLVLNEMTMNSLFSLVVFGLLEGWWRFVDEPLRISGSPVISADGWHALLSDEGFVAIMAPTDHASHLGQQVFVARNDDQIAMPTHAIGNVLHNEPVIGTETPFLSTERQAQLYEKIVVHLVEQVALLLKYSPDEIDTSLELSRYGFDSIGAAQWINQFNTEHQLSLSPAILYQHPSIDTFARFLVDEHSDTLGPQFLAMKNEPKPASNSVNAAESATKVSSTHRDVQQHRVAPTVGAQQQAIPVSLSTTQSDNSGAIAIVGMSGRFPGADSIDSFWENLKKGRSGISEVPASRWQSPSQNGAVTAGSVKNTINGAGFMPAVDEFDAEFFGISAFEAERMEPQQRLLMQHVWNAIENAGYAASSMAGQRTALFVGAGIGEYTPMLLEHGVDMGQLGMFGLSPSTVANRISHMLDLRGPSCAIDTACSSSLVAIHRGCQAIRHEGCESAIVAGVNTLLTPTLFDSYGAAGLLSPDAKCKTFAASADGFARSEGVGVLLLKPLSKAIADGDNIQAVIRGSAENHGGRSQSWVAPNPSAQADAIVDAYRQGNVSPESVGFIEVHGTGTLLGDSIEVDALKQAFTKMGDDSSAHCALGTAKTLVGHTEFAAGVTGVIKSVLQLQHKVLLAGHPGEELNPYINLDDTPFYLPENSEKWAPPETVNGLASARRAGVSAFGIGGVNAHVLVEEYVADAQTSETRIANPRPILLSAKNEKQLVERMVELKQFIEKNKPTDECFDSLCFTLQCGRETMSSRIGFIASSITDLHAKLQCIIEGDKPQSTVWRANAARSNTLASWFNADDQLKEALQQWIQREKYERLIEAWVNGVSIEWINIYGNAVPKRISLPGYPFAKTTHWVAATRPKSRASAASTLESTAVTNVASLNKTQEPNATTNGSVIQPEVSLNGLNDVELMVEVLVEQKAPNISSATTLHLLCIAHQERTVKQIAAQLGTSEHLSFEWLPAPVESDQLSIEHQFEKTLKANMLAAKNSDAIVYLCGVEDSDALEKLDYIASILYTLDQQQSTIPQLILCTQAHTPEQRAYADAWIGFERSVSQRKVSVLRYESGVNNDGVVPQILKQSLIDTLAATANGYGSAVYRDGRRFVFENQTQLWPHATTKLSRTRQTVLITGGSGGVGHTVALHLAKRYQADLILLGRSQSNSTIEAQLNTLRSCGVNAEYFSADIADFKATNDLLERAENSMGKITGIIHAAGVHDPMPLAEKSVERFEAVLQPKVAGTKNISIFAQQRNVEFVFLMSSSSAIVGDLGACDYSIGNRFAASYANVIRETSGIHTVAVHWGMWDGLGMAAFDDKDQRAMLLKTTQQRPIAVEQCLQVFDQLLQSSEQHPWQVRAKTRPSDTQALRRQPQDAPGNAVVSNQGDGYLQRAIIEAIATATGCSVESVNPHAVFAEFGVDSVTAMALTDQLSGWVGEPVSPTVFFAHPTIKRLANYLESTYSVITTDNQVSVAPALNAATEQKPPAVAINQAPLKSLNHENYTVKPDENALAIVGISGRFPSARNRKEFWEILANQSVVTDKIDRSVDGMLMNLLGLEFAHNGEKFNAGLAPGIDEFDPYFFGITPKDAERMDPRQRLLLQEAWAALEDAGIGPDELANSTLGIYVGVEEGDYKFITGADTNLTASHDGILAGRIGYFLNSNGPVVSINTACSSGLVAFHQACLGVQAGDCDTAIVGGVNLLTTPLPIEGMRSTGMLSPTGICRAFDRDADGMIPAEGIVAVVVKRLTKAIDDRDNILATVAGSGINYDGRSNGITAPNEHAQAALLKQTYAKHQLDPTQLDYLITHGTGTPLGDPIEIRAIDQALGHAKSKNTCWVGSVKSNVGHAMAASGLVSIAGMLESFEHETIPASVNINHESDYFNWRNSRFKVATTAQRWPKKSEQPRMGAISAFGMSGTNAHVVLTDFKQRERPDPATKPAAVVIVFSAASAETLKSVARLLREHVVKNHNDHWFLIDFAFTLMCCRHHFSHRCAFVAQDVNDVLTALDEYLLTGEMSNGYTGVANKAAGKASASLIELMANFGQDSSSVQAATQVLLTSHCAGIHLDWSKNSFFVNGRKQRLPTYPFSRDRYWATPAQNSSAIKQTPKLPLNGVDHTQVSIHEQKLIIDSDFASISDHVARGVQVVPGSAFLSMCVSAQVSNAAKNPNSPYIFDTSVGYQFTSSSWKRPVPLLNKATALTIQQNQTDNKQQSLIEVKLGSNGSTQGVCFETLMTPLKQARPTNVDLNGIRQHATKHRVTKTELYSELSTHSLELGPAYRSVVAIDAYSIDDCWHAIATISINSPITDNRIADGLMLQLADSALQSTLWLMGLDRDGMNQHTTALMVGVETIKVWPDNDSNAVAWVRQRSNAKEAFDIDICANNGRILMQWRNVKFHVFAEKDAISNVSTAQIDDSYNAVVPRQTSLVLAESLKASLAKQFSFDITRIAIDEPFDRYGIDSVSGLEWLTELEKDFGSLSQSTFNNCTTLIELAESINNRAT